MATLVVLDDGTEEPLHDHLRDVHGKGTMGLTDEYLGGMHHALHSRLGDGAEHSHPEPPDEA